TSSMARNSSFQSILGTNLTQPNRHGSPAVTVSPNRVTNPAWPIASSSTLQSCSLPPVGTTTSVSPIRPLSALNDTTPSSATTRHSPAGPSTRNFCGTSSLRPTGHSLGLFQSYGPHS